MSEAQYGALADQAAKKYGVDPRLYRALIKQESGWNASAVSHAGARGLTQVVPKWHPGANLSTPAGQLDYGAKHLSTLLRNFKSPRLALAAYNAGAGAVKKYGDVPPFAETQNYVTKILGAYGAGGGAAPQSGGAAPTDPGGASLPVPSGSLDGKRLMGILNATRTRVLRGEMPGKNYQSELQKLVSQAIPRGLASAGANAVGAQAVSASASMIGAAADASSAQVINAAKGALGTPYSWGGGTPSGPTKGFGRGANTVGFDCSSLVQMAWAKAGVQLPRTTYEQIKVGQAVPNLAQARPGDLLFPSTGHVQMYLGDGKVIEAPRTGGKVQIVPARSKYIAIRRPSK